MKKDLTVFEQDVNCFLRNLVQECQKLSPKSYSIDSQQVLLLMKFLYSKKMRDLMRKINKVFSKKDKLFLPTAGVDFRVILFDIDFKLFFFKEKKMIFSSELENLLHQFLMRSNISILHKNVLLIYLIYGKDGLTEIIKFLPLYFSSPIKIGVVNGKPCIEFQQYVSKQMLLLWVEDNFKDLAATFKQFQMVSKRKQDKLLRDLQIFLLFKKGEKQLHISSMLKISLSTVKMSLERLKSHIK